MKDIFEEEQIIHDEAIIYLMKLQQGEEFDIEKFHSLIKEYRRLLKQLRRVTKISDRATGTLNNSKHDLLDKVHFDALTGIYNRRFMEDSLKRIIKSLSRSGDILSVLMMDVDFFKKYNDTYGHSEGDECLKTIAETIKNSLSRANDFAVRYGGEEFAVLLPGTDRVGAEYIAQKILENVRAKKITHEKSDVSEFVTISIGITSHKPDNTLEGSDFIRKADKALYQSKQNGRNQYTFIEF